jgi:DeoR/GlpR family transcriptional regulator of sugar metabolism
MRTTKPPQNLSKSQKFSRLQFIESVLKTQGNITTAFVCQKFGVSDQTARTDLATLEKQGLCQKTYGGAVSSFGQVRDVITPFGANMTDVASTTHVLKNQVISRFPEIFRAATSTFLPGDAFLLNLFGNPEDLFPPNSAIYTNSIDYASHHANNTAYRVVLLPGAVNITTSITDGATLEDYMRAFAKISCAIFSINYIDNQTRTVGFESELYGRIAQEMIQTKNARHIIFIATPDLHEGNPSFHYLQVAPQSIDLLILTTPNIKLGDPPPVEWARRIVSVQIDQGSTSHDKGETP